MPAAAECKESTDPAVTPRRLFSSPNLYYMLKGHSRSKITGEWTSTGRKDLREDSVQRFPEWSLRMGSSPLPADTSAPRDVCPDQAEQTGLGSLGETRLVWPGVAGPCRGGGAGGGLEPDEG